MLNIRVIGVKRSFGTCLPLPFETQKTFTRTMSSTSIPPSTPKFAASVDPDALGPLLSKVLKTSGGRWTLAREGEAVERTFRFKTFAKTWDFMTAVSLQCKVHNHHPQWSNVYNTAFIRWTTHNPKGLSEKDVNLSMICDSLASDFGEVIETPDLSQASPSTPNAASSSLAGPGCALGGLADTAVASSDNCCSPKKL